MENVVISIVVYYKSFYVRQALLIEKIPVPAFFRKGDTLQKPLFFLLLIAFTWLTMHKNKALCMFYTTV